MSDIILGILKHCPLYAKIYAEKATVLISSPVARSIEFEFVAIQQASSLNID